MSKRTQILLAATAAATAGCTASTASAPRVQQSYVDFATDMHVEQTCVARAPDGDASMMRTPLGDGSRFGAVESSPQGWHAGAYVRVQGQGSRSLLMGPEARAHACAARPLTDDASLCPVVSTEAFGHAIESSLQAIGIAAIGPELGVGGQLNWDPGTPHGHEQWRMSVRIADWADADTALAVVARALDAWGIAAPFGVSVAGTVCPDDVEPMMLELIDELR